MLEIVAAKPWHCGAIVRRLRPEHLAAIAEQGRDAHHELTTAYRRSYYRRAAVLDGELIALGGLIGSPLSTGAHAWLAVANSATQHRFAVARAAKAAIAQIISVKYTIAASCLEVDEMSVRFCEFLGFRFDASGSGLTACHLERPTWPS